jgi:uncharacterized Fe-S cluster protein YjdI
MRILFLIPDLCLGSSFACTQSSHRLCRNFTRICTHTEECTRGNHAIAHAY